MTRQTELYLLNYLQKKSLTMAAAQEVNEASNVFCSSELRQLKTLRKGHALAFADKCRVDEAAAFDAYMAHLQAGSGAGP